MQTTTSTPSATKTAAQTENYKSPKPLPSNEIVHPVRVNRNKTTEGVIIFRPVSDTFNKHCETTAACYIKKL
jgi:hypothetical protein